MNATPSAPPRPGDLVGDPGEWALFLDFDGTLVELAATPETIVVPREVPALLDGLAAHLGGALAVLTGRALANLDRHLGIPQLAAAGQHGAERRLAGGRTHVLAEPGVMARARAETARFAAAHPGVMAEDKGASIALHFRAAPALHAAVLVLADRLVAVSEGALERIEGKYVCELRPAGSNKGSALAAFLLDAPFAGRRPLAIGDDVTDEAAFAAALAVGGGAIKVGEGKSAAPWWLPDPAAVRAWLAGMLAESRSN